LRASGTTKQGASRRASGTRHNLRASGAMAREEGRQEMSMPLTRLREQEPHASRHTLSVLVENKPGVLVRVAGLFSRRNFNIESLAVGPTEHLEISRMTIVVNCAEHPLEQVTKQLNKLINVLKIVELEPSVAVQRELLLVKVRADAETRSRVLETVALFRAKVVDVAQDAVTVEATGNRDKLDALIRVLEPFGIKELVQSGMVALGRGSKSITDRALRPIDRAAAGPAQ
jgi:acetolactate synthase-1/3 small subunit